MRIKRYVIARVVGEVFYLGDLPDHPRVVSWSPDITFAKVFDTEAGAIQYKEIWNTWLTSEAFVHEHPLDFYHD